MTRRTNARLAGFMFLFYIATAFPSMVLFDRATAGADTAAKLATIARHTAHMRATAVLQLITIVDALVLAVALYALTRDEDRDLAILALSCRVVEGVINAVPTFGTLGLLFVANTPGDASASNAIADVLLKLLGWSTSIGGTLFAVGSTLFAYLLLRSRAIPALLAWLGVIGSLLIVVILPLQMVRLIGGPITSLMWIPIAAFEVTLGLRLLIKGVNN